MMEHIREKYRGKLAWKICCRASQLVDKFEHDFTWKQINQMGKDMVGVSPGEFPTSDGCRAGWKLQYVTAIFRNGEILIIWT